jgi:hypothetical protein
MKDKKSTTGNLPEGNDETWLKQYVEQVNAGFKSEQEILDGLEYINQTLILQGFSPMTLEDYKESLKHPISDELLPRYTIKSSTKDNE